MHRIIKLTLLQLQFRVFHIRLGIFLLDFQLRVFLPVLFLEILGLGLDHFERRESEERRWLWRHDSLLLQLLRHLPRRRRRRQGRPEVLLRAVAEAVVVVAVQDMLLRAEVVGFGILLQLMRLLAPVLSVLLVVVVVVVVVMMELHFLLVLLTPLSFDSGRRQVPFLLFLPLFDESIQTVPHLFFFYFRTVQVDLSCHLCTYSTFKGLGAPTAHVCHKL